MERMIENRVHRVWIVESEESDRVIGVVSQSEILGEILGVSHQAMGIQMYDE